LHTDTHAGSAPHTEAQPADAPAPKPTRRRRAAGRPAGAPAQVTGAVDLVLPLAGTPKTSAKAHPAADPA
jgi:hypothetical protein